MTALPPDPDPRSTTGQDRGGGVPPGETPPDSAQTSAADRDPVAGRNLNPRTVIAFVAVGLFITLFVVCAVVLGVQIFT